MTTALASSSSIGGASTGITTHHTHIPSPLPTAPSFNLHLTRFRDTLLVWVGTAPSTSGPSELGEEGGQSGEKRLAADWAVSMPARGNIPVTATPVYRSSSSDLSLAMSQRLAKRFPGNQIHLSLSLSSTLIPTQGSSHDPFASKVVLIMEKKLGVWLEEIVGSKAGGKA